MSNLRRLFCWSGGGLPGLDIHVGIWKALSECGIESTANAGTSAGAIVAALNSHGTSVACAENIVRALSDGDVRSERLFWKLRIPLVDYFLSSKPIERLLAELLPEDFDALGKPLSVFVTDERIASSVEICRGQTLRAMVRASAAIMGVFPPVGHYSDGGTTQYLPLPDGWNKYDEVYLLIAKRPLNYLKKTGILTRLIYNADVLQEDQVGDTIRFACENHPRVVVVRPPFSAPAGSLHFDHSLIRKSYDYARSYIGGNNKWGAITRGI